MLGARYNARQIGVTRTSIISGPLLLYHLVDCHLTHQNYKRFPVLYVYIGYSIPCSTFSELTVEEGKKNAQILLAMKTSTASTAEGR